MVSDSSKRGDPIPGVVIRGRYGHRRSFAAKRWIMDLLISKLTKYLPPAAIRTISGYFRGGADVACASEHPTLANFRCIRPHTIQFKR